MAAMFRPLGLFSSMFLLITYCVFFYSWFFLVVVDVVEMKWIKSPWNHEARVFQVNLGNSMLEIKPTIIKEKEEGNERF